MGYDAATLAQKFVWSATDAASGNNQGSIWQSGNGVASDSSGNVYVETANGAFDANSGGINYSDSVVKLTSNAAVLDYFTPLDQSLLSTNDIDLGSGGPIILPDSVASPATPSCWSPLANQGSCTYSIGPIWESSTHSATTICKK